MRTRLSNGSRLRKPIISSAIFHMVILITLSVTPGLNFPFREKPMRIDVTWVELPRGTGEDLGLGLKKAEQLPQSTIEEQQKTFQPEAPEMKALAPEMKAPPEKTAEEKPKEQVKPEPRPEIKTPKMTKTDAKLKPKAASKADRQIQNALAKIDKQLTGRQVVPEAAQVAAGNEGYKYGTSDKPLRVSPSDPEYLKYQAMVRGRIIREWVVPTVYAEEGGKRFSSRIDVRINVDGEVTSTRLERASGNASFDQSAIRAVKKASPFPTPPDRLAWEAYNEGFLIEFDPRMKPQ
ncbi:MAG: cell envelope integrity protein TolA [Pseudomonadota bacterium]